MICKKYLFRYLIVLISCIFFFSLSGCTKAPAKTALVEKPTVVEQEIVTEKQTIVEKKSEVEKPILAEKQPVPEVKTALVEKPVIVEQEIVTEKQTVVEKKSEVEKPVVAEKPVLKKQPVAEESKKATDVKKYLNESHLVRKGESLWWISKYKDRYNDPYMWPIIYEVNKKEIKKPDMIYPGQKLLIPRKGYKINDIKKVRAGAGAPKPYTPPAGSILPVN